MKLAQIDGSSGVWIVRISNDPVLVQQQLSFLYTIYKFQRLSNLVVGKLAVITYSTQVAYLVAVT